MLWAASATLGLGYGGMFGLFPTIMIEWFGLGMYAHRHGFRRMLTGRSTLFPELGVSLHLSGHRRQSVQSSIWGQPRRAFEPTSGRCREARRTTRIRR